MRIYRSGHYSGSLYDPPKPTPPDPKKGQNKPKTYPITRSRANLFTARAINLFERREHKVKSCILTYPALYDADPYPDWNRFKANLEKNYGLNSYVSALEITKNFQYHFHLLLDMPYLKASKMNDIWLKASKRSDGAKNAIRDFRNVRSDLAVIKYVSNYLTKKESKDHDLRKFTESRKTFGNEYVELDRQQWDKWQKRGALSSISHFTTDYTVGGRLYMNEFVRTLFTKS